MGQWIKRGALACLPVLLAACVNTPATRDVVGNPEAHLAQFAPATLNKEVAAKLPAGEPELGFRRMEVDMQLTEVRSDERNGRDAVTTTHHYVNAGRGLVQSWDEVRNNDVPFRVNYKLSYRGLLQLKWQTVFHSRPNADMPYEIKTFKRFDSLPASLAANRPFEYGMNWGTQVQVAGYRDTREACTPGATAPASQLHASLKGEWRELNCENYGPNGTISSKTSFAWLPQYGIVLQRSFVDSATRNTYAIKAVRVQ